MLRKTIIILFCALFSGGCGLLDSRKEFKFAGPKPRAVAPVPAEEVQASIKRGVRFLLNSQSASGYWGTIRSKGWNVEMPTPEGFDAMRGAVTSLAVMALIETDDGSPQVEQAIRKGEVWLIKYLPKVRRSEYVIYSNWSDAYGIEVMVKLLERGPDHPERVRAIHAVIDKLMGRLQRSQRIDAGWGYYNYTPRGPLGHRESDSNSFMTGTVLVAFAEARAAGIPVPEKVVSRAVESLRTQRQPDFTYSYHFWSKLVPEWEMNRKPGSLARSQVCNLGVRLSGDEAVTDAVLTAWLDRLFARNGWLSMARKTSHPHASFYGVAGYFFYYGHYYAMRCMELLPPSEWPQHQAQMVHVLLPLQEKDGSWWDYAVFGYHQIYGTSFALMSLERCLKKEPDVSFMKKTLRPTDGEKR